MVLDPKKPFDQDPKKPEDKPFLGLKFGVARYDEDGNVVIEPKSLGWFIEYKAKEFGFDFIIFSFLAMLFTYFISTLSFITHKVTFQESFVTLCLLNMLYYFFISTPRIAIKYMFNSFLFLGLIYIHSIW